MGGLVSGKRRKPRYGCCRSALSISRAEIGFAGFLAGKFLMLNVKAAEFPRDRQEATTRMAVPACVCLPLMRHHVRGAVEDAGPGDKGNACLSPSVSWTFRASLLRSVRRAPGRDVGRGCGSADLFVADASSTRTGYRPSVAEALAFPGEMSAAAIPGGRHAHARRP